MHPANRMAVEARKVGFVREAMRFDNRNDAIHIALTLTGNFRSPVGESMAVSAGKQSLSGGKQGFLLRRSDRVLNADTRDCRDQHAEQPCRL